MTSRNTQKVEDPACPYALLKASDMAAKTTDVAAKPAASTTPTPASSVDPADFGHPPEGMTKEECAQILRWAG